MKHNHLEQNDFFIFCDPHYLLSGESHSFSEVTRKLEKPAEPFLLLGSQIGASRVWSRKLWTSRRFHNALCALHAHRHRRPSELPTACGWADEARQRKITPSTALCSPKAEGLPCLPWRLPGLGGFVELRASESSSTLLKLVTRWDITGFGGFKH